MSETLTIEPDARPTSGSSAALATCSWLTFVFFLGGGIFYLCWCSGALCEHVLGPSGQKVVSGGSLCSVARRLSDAGGNQSQCHSCASREHMFAVSSGRIQLRTATAEPPVTKGRPPAAGVAVGYARLGRTWRASCGRRCSRPTRGPSTRGARATRSGCKHRGS